MKKILLLLAITLTIQITNAQGNYQGGQGHGENMPTDGIIKGQIINSNTNTAIAYSTVAIFSSKDSSVVAGVLTGEDGNFKFENLKYGKYFLKADFIGFFKKTISEIKVFPQAKEYDCGVIKLDPSDNNIEEVQVMGDVSAVQYKIDRQVVNVSQNLNSSGGTLADVLSNTPSINVDIEGNVSLRGSSNFTVLIDGKPSILDAADALNQMPASQVESIEIITNPSAKFDPDGTAGIINIITKKKNDSGFSGIINASAGTGDKYSGDFLLNFKTKKFNIFFGGEAGQRNFSGNGTSSRETYLTDTTNFLNTSSEMIHGRTSYSGKLGFDYYLNDKNTISFSGSIGKFDFSRNMYSSNREYSVPASTDINLYNEGLFSMHGPYYKSSLEFKHDFAKKGHKLNFLTEFSFRDGGLTNNNIESFVDTEGNFLSFANRINTFQDRGEKILEFNTDYVYPINENSKLEAGLGAELSLQNGDYTYEIYDTLSGIWSDPMGLSNKLNFIEDIYQIYSTYSNKSFGFEYMIGLRGEYTYRLIDQETSGEQYLVDRFDFFPSFHISRNLPKEQQLLASYSRRVNRPRHWFLNPFPGYTDSYSTRVGNPALLPEFVDSYELNYQKTFKKTVFTTAFYYRKTNNAITQIQTMQDNGILLTTFANLNKTYAYGAELSVNTQLAKWWKLFVNANFYQYQIKSTVAGDDLNISSTNYDFKLNSTFIVSNNIKIQLNGFYNAPTVTAQGKQEGFVSFDLAYRHDFLQKKLSVVLKVQDPLQTAKFATTTEGTNFYTSDLFYREAPVFMLSLSYKINNYKQDKKRPDDGNMDEGGM
jgi:outer membrane receptor protein involved in Fe transport